MINEKITIYHNNRCSKSRQALCFIEEHEKQAIIIDYLKNAPTEKELRSLLKKIGKPAQDIVRKNESLYKEKYKDKKLSETEWIKVLSENPILIERPIVVKGDKAIIARPPELVNEFLK